MDMPERIAKLEAQVESIKDDVNELKTDVKEIHSRITTGNREIMDKIESMEILLEKRMRENSEQAAKQHKEIEKTVRTDVDDLAEKISKIEQWKWMIIGGAIVVGYFIGNLDPITKLLGN